MRKVFHMAGIYINFPQCVVSSNALLENFCMICFLTSMFNNVGFKFIVSHKSYHTGYIGMVSRPNVFSDVFKIRIFSEFLTTKDTLIPFFTSVHSQVIFKITFLWKGFITMDTLIWFFPSVHLQVFFKMTFPWKGLSQSLHGNCFSLFFVTFVWSLEKKHSSLEYVLADPYLLCNFRRITFNLYYILH